MKSKKTKIIATLGPASSTPKVLEAMIANGLDMIRINASHATSESELSEKMNLIRKAAKKVDRPIGVFMDLQGPKIRVGEFKNKEEILEEGQSFILTNVKCEGTHKKAFISYENLAEDVKIGHPIYINDGKIQMEAVSIKNGEVHCIVKKGGVISNRKGVNLPQTDLSISPFTPKDQQDAKIAVSQNVDYIALSFVSDPQDVLNFRAFLKENKAENIKIISKIERQQAVDRLSEIVAVSDAIMVARGDLGVEIGVEKVPQVQKQIIRLCNRMIKPVIVATQMLESMITSEVATRAEVSDVANAIYDHCDAVMLSGETAVGINPVNVIQTMADICSATDGHVHKIRDEDNMSGSHRFEIQTTATSFCRAADQVAEENQATAIIAFTSSGNTPMIASKFNPAIPIIAPTDDKAVWQRMTLYRGVIPIMMPKKFKEIHRWTDMIHLALKEAVEIKLLKKGDTVVVTAGIPIGQSNGINSIRIITV